MENIREISEKLFNETPDNVTGVSYGYKIKNGQKTGELSIIFNVKEKKPLDQLNPEEVLPSTVQSGDQIIITDVVSEELPTLMTCYTDVNDANIQRLRGNPNMLLPMKGGQEIIQFPDNWTFNGGWGYYVGTLGFFAVDNNDNRVVGVTNSHVVCYRRLALNEQNRDVSNADPYNLQDDRIWNFNGNGYPAGALSIDGNTLTYPCLRIKRFRSVSNVNTNYVDGALMLMSAGSTTYVDNNSYQIWQSTGDADYTTHMPFATTAEIDNLLTTNPYVFSTGRTTGPKGYSKTATCTLRITQIAVNTFVSDAPYVQSWGDCIRFEYEDASVDPVAGGDSGSALVAEIGGVRKIIGLVFAGSGVGRYGLANRIDRVAQELNIRAWDSSYTLNTTYPTLTVKTADANSDYVNLESFVLDGKTYYQAGFTQNRNFSTLGPVPTNTPTPTATPVPTPTSTPVPSGTGPTPTPTATGGANMAWGFGSFGSNGDLTAISRSSPVQVAINDLGTFMDGGYSMHGGFITTTGKLYTWGGNSYGQLGHNDSVLRSSPTQVGTDSNWDKVSGGLFTLASKTDGSLWGWGLNSSGNLGTNDVISRSSPVQIAGAGSPYLSLAASSYNSAVVKGDGTLWVAGNNYNGILGTGDLFHRSSLTQIGSDNNWQMVTAGIYNTAAIKSDGTLWAWGMGQYGLNGQNNTVNLSSPTQVGSGTDWTYVNSVYLTFHALKQDGSIWFLGQGGESPTNVSSPAQIITGKNFTKVVQNLASTYGLTNTGEIWSWGSNAYGSMGELATSISPAQLWSDTTWTDIFAAYANGFAIK